MDKKLIVLEQIEKSAFDVGNFIGFTVGNKFYLYSKKSGIFYSYKHQIKELEVVQVQSFIGIIPKNNKYSCKSIVLVENNRVTVEGLKELKPLGSCRGGVNGRSYIGLTFYNEKGYKETFYAQTIVALLKFGLYKVLETFGSGSKYVVDHINNEKLFNGWKNIQILTRRDNRWGKKGE